MKIEVQFFARARDLAGAETVRVELNEGRAVADLRSILVNDYPELKPIAATLLFAVGNDYVTDEATLTGESVACFPPVSGG